MKIKTFILTFLIMSCPFLFGQQTGANYDWGDAPSLQNNALMIAKLAQIDGVTDYSNYEIGAFCGDAIRGKARATQKGDFYLTISLQNATESISFRLYDHAADLEIFNVYETTTLSDASHIGSPGNSANVSATYVAKIGNAAYPTINAAIEAAQEGETVTILEGDYTQEQGLNINKAITVQGERNDQDENLVNIKGELNITADGATAKNLNVNNGGSTAGYINAKNVTVDGCTVVGGNGFRYCYTTGLVTFKNSTITGSTYGIHFDGSAGGNIVIDNCVITGWTSFASTITKVTMKGTSFEEGNYNYVRFYQDEVVIEDCIFNENMAIDIAIDGNNTTIDNCTFENGNIEDLFEGSDIVNSTIIVDGNTLKREASIGNTYYETLAEALEAAQNGDEVKILAAGNYALSTSGKNITITGAVDGVVFDNIGAKNMGGANVTFNKVTFDYYPNVNYTGLQHSGNLVYNDCTFEGQPFLYGTRETFNKCTFNQNSADAYNVWTYGAKEVAFNECTFNSAGKSVLIYSEQSDLVNNVTVTDCDFIASDPVEGKAAIEMNSEHTAGINLTIDAATTATGFGSGNVSGNSLWNNKKGNETEANNDITVVVNNETVLAPLPLVAELGGVKYTSLQEAIDAATEGQTVTVINDVELENTVTVATGKVVTLDLNGKVVSYTSDVQGETMITNNGNLTVTDNTEAKEGKIAYIYTGAADSNYGKGNYTFTNQGVLSIENVEVTVKAEDHEGKFPHALYVIQNAKTLTIDNAQIINNNNVAIRQWATTANENVVTVKGENAQITGVRAIWIQLPSNNTTSPVVKLNIENGTLTGLGEGEGENINKLAIYSYSYGQNMQNVEINISGGTFNGDIALTGGSNKNNIETLNITDGIFNGYDGDVYSYGADEKAVGAISITGGTFSSNYAEKYALDNGYVFVQNQDGKYKLEEFEGFEIPNLDRLIAFRNAVNAGNTFAGQTVTVTDNINMESVENWTPIGTLENPFNGTFDGGNKTISNLNVNGGAYVGLFGYADNATIKNVKINNANVKGTNCVGVIAGDVYSTSLIDNCHVSGSIKVEGQTNVGGIVGKYYTKVTNSSVIGDGVATSYVKGVHYAADYEGDNIGGIMGHGGENNTFTNNTVKNITISGTRKVGGIVGVTDQNTDVTNCLVENVNIETTATAEYASANAAKAGHASIVGSYTKLGTNNNGTVTNCVVKNVTFVNEGDVVVSFGPITGGAREGMIDPTGVTASGNLVYMSTITGNTTNMYLMKAVAKIDETNYYTLDEAIAAANNQTVTVLENVELRNTLTIEAGKTVTLDLNGKTINTAWEDESAEKHYYAFDNKGTLTITDSSTEANGVINARGNFNYGTLTLEEGSINAIDHNGGYGVRNYEGSKFTMKGGLIATTNENGDAPTEGYDATTVRVDSDAEFIMNGGNINNISNFTIGIENYGTTTINENAGEVKSVHTTVGNHGTMTINGGTFICNGLDGVTAHALWATDGSTTTIYGGTFDGKDNYNGFNVNASEGAVVEINGGNFESVHSGSLYGDGTITVKGGTFFDEVEEERLAPGYVCKQNADGTYGVFLGVAKIEGGAIYGTLQAAITAAAQSGNTIVLLADITENVTVDSKSLTIDGAEKSYTGNIAVKGSASSTAVTVKNVNFVNGTGYAITTNRIKSITVEDCTVNNYGFGFLYANKTTTNVIVKNVTVNGGSYGLRWLYGTTATFENVKMENVTDGFEIHTYGAKTINVKDCDITSIDIYYQSATNQTFKFEGANKVGTLSDSQYAKYQLVPAASTLAAPAGFDVTTSSGYIVEYKEGEYVVKAAIAQIGDEIYASLQEAINAAADNDVIEVLQDINLENVELQTLDGKYNTYFKVEGKNVTINLNGKRISGNYTGTSMLVGVFSTDNNGHLTLTGNGTVDVTAGTTVYSLVVCYEDECTITIENGTYTLDKASDNLIYYGGKTDAAVTVKGGTFTLGNVNTGENGKPWIFNVLGAGDHHVYVTGGTFNADINRQHWSNEAVVAETHYMVANVDGTYTVKEGAEAYVATGMLTGGWFYRKNIGYATLEEALAKAQEFVDPNLTLLQNVEFAESLTIEAGKEIILDLNGKTITGKDNNESGSFNLFVNNGTFEIKDDSAEGTGKITLEATTNRYWNASSSIVSNSAGTLTITSGTLEHLGGTDMAYGIDNNSTLGLTTLNVDGGKIASPYRAIRQFQNSLQDNVVVVNGGTISARAGIWMQQPSTNDKAQLGTLTINDGSIFECVSNAVVIDICGGAQSNVTINGGTFSNTNENANLLLIWPLTDMNSVHENCSAVMNITGGNFTCAGEGNLIGILDGANTNGDVVLTGGIYSEDVNAYCAEGFAAVDNSDGTWTVMPVQEQSLVKGWNWYSTYIDINGAQGLTKIENALGTNGIEILSHLDGWRLYEDGEWYGELAGTDVKKMYKIEVGEGGVDMRIAGNIVDFTNETIEIVDGFNWISYPFNQPMNLNDALSGFTPAEGDYIISHFNFAFYYDNQWEGSLESFTPGEGYIYERHGSNTELSYNVSNIRSTVKANVTTEGNNWVPNGRLYPNNMTMIAVVDGLANGNYEVAAFVNGEVRGSARPIYVEALDAYMLFLTIHGDEVEEMSFKLYDIDNDTEYDLSDRINYSNNAHLGSVNEPYVFSRGTTGIGEASMSEVNIYPNPTTTGTEINLEATCDKVEVFNALGVKVAEYQNVDTIDALETAGIYVIRITNNGNVQNCRLVVK